MGLLGFLLAVFSLPGSASADTAKPPVTPVQAELLSDLEARHLKAGDVLYATVFTPWDGPNCALKPGAILKATVVSAVPHTKSSPASEVALSFNAAQCAHSELGPFSLILAALAAPEDPNTDQTMDMPRIIGAGVSSANNPPNGTRSLDTFDSDMWWQMVKGFARYSQVHAGGVYGLHGLSLSVATGPENSSVLTAKDRDVALYKHTQLLLIPGALVTTRSVTARAVGSGTSAPSPSANPASARVKTAPVAAPPPPEQPLLEDQTCAPPECSIALPPSDAEEPSHAASTISIRSLGYSPRPEKEMAAFDDDETLTWLGPADLLVTFNPHTLVPRMGNTAGGTVRVIRAVLINTTTQKVGRMVDWRMPDKKRYLWPLADHRVLVHVGNELRIYGPGLHVEQTLTLDGPLAFVRTDPAGRTIVAGIVRERHSPALHAELRERAGREPDEDVQILVMNNRFQTTATARSSTELLPPVFLNEGEVKLYRQTDKRFHIVMQTWTGERLSLARFGSACTPELAAVPPDLLFLVTCRPSTLAREYRLLRNDGKVVVQGDSPLLEVGYAASGDADLNEVMLKTVESADLLDAGIFHPSDLKSERVRVYSAANGKRLFTAQVPAPSPSQGGFAITPDGRQMAILTREQIVIYAVPAQAAN